jgi:hypothetical protein
LLHRCVVCGGQHDGHIGVPGHVPDELELQWCGWLDVGRDVHVVHWVHGGGGSVGRDVHVVDGRDVCDGEDDSNVHVVHCRVLGGLCGLSDGRDVCVVYGCVVSAQGGGHDVHAIAGRDESAEGVVQMWRVSCSC